MCLIEACEAIERNNPVPEKNPQSENNKNSQTGIQKPENKRKNERKKLNKKPLKHCSVHGHNPTHDSSECYTLKNQARSGNHPTEAKANSSQTFTAKKFRKEINLLAKKSSKKKVLELYANAVKQEQKKFENKKCGKSSKPTAEEASSDSDEDSNISIHMVTRPTKKKRVGSKPQPKTRSETTDEESEYQKMLQAKWLQDYGELNTDFNNNLDADPGAKEN